MNKLLLLILIIFQMFSCLNKDATKKSLKKMISTSEYFPFIKAKALEVVKTGFNAGDGYGEVWIRDYNTFIELSAEVFEKEILKENLLIFFRMQGDNGNIIDGFIPKSKVQEGGYNYIYSDLEPRYAGHKNTVETDQESSLVQAVYKYIMKTGDRSILIEKIGQLTVSDRLELAMNFLINERFNDKFKLLWGATTADWGDVQPEHDWGVYLTDDTHYCIDIYDNAMFIIALNNLMELIPKTKIKWEPIHNQFTKNIRLHLWDSKNQKFIPHIYLNGSPFPKTFDENKVFYHGGTAIAIEADLLTKEEVRISLKKMIANVKQSGAGSIGLTLFPTYPEGSFKNKGMYPYGYQNGGDWTWFGGRMIQQLIRFGYVQEAFEQMTPMAKRVKHNDGFFEWYTVDNKPKGSGTFRGSAGVLYKAIIMFEEYSYNNEESVITPSEEQRNPLLATYASEKSATIKTSNKGISLSEKGIFITAFTNNKNGPGDLFRLREQKGKNADQSISLPRNSDWRFAQAWH